MSFEIPAIRMPTEEELFASCSVAYARAGPTYIDNWPEELRALSLPTKLVPINSQLMANLFETEAERDAAAPEIASILDAEMGW